jgi:phenylalanyl-tRNA synthetase alpha chain
MEIVKDITGDLAENVTKVDEFTHPKTERKSLC